MRIAFVVQRYGLDVHGGAEFLCRAWAERLAARHDVEVLTTCARDYLTWADYYPPGDEWINGVLVRRFPVDQPRDLPAFDAFSLTIFGRQHSPEQELEWMRLQGPYSGALLAELVARRDELDRFVFITYLYASTFFGLPLVADKAILVPTAHDEPPIYLDLFRQLFAAPRALIYLTTAERMLLSRLFDLYSKPGAIVGVGVDCLQEAAQPPLAGPPTLLYVGRVHMSKGCDQLFEYFARYRSAGGQPARLVFAGRADMAMPEHPDVEYLGYVDEAEKARLLAECSLLIMPSPFESLSIVCLEAWAAGRPTLANARSEVLREQSLASGGGLFYASYAEFAAGLDLLLGDPQLRERLGRQGRGFVAQRYSWPAVERQLEAALRWDEPRAALDP